MAEEKSLGATLEAAAAFGVLADIDRFKVIAAIAIGSNDLDDIVRTTGVERRTAEKALSRLVAADLVSNEDGFWRVRFDELHEIARAAASERSSMEDAPEGAGLVARRFFRGERLKAIPAARSKRLEVLDHLAQSFDPGRTYTEAEVNGVLSRFHEDYAALRRYMVDDELLERAEGKYWRSGGTFDV
jgi:hypothetical protein